MIAFVRHGQTMANREGRLQGRLDPPLSDVGVAQAAALGDWFASETVTRVLSSPLQRAQDTAAAIAAAHGLTVEVDERLIELDYGEWDGMPLTDIPLDDWARWRVDTEFAPPGGERLGDVAARVESFCADMLGEEPIVAVSHVSPIKAAVSFALGVDEAATWRMFLSVAAITRIGARGDTPYLASYNEVTRP